MKVTQLQANGDLFVAWFDEKGALVEAYTFNAWRWVSGKAGDSNASKDQAVAAAAQPRGEGLDQSTAQAGR